MIAIRGAVFVDENTVEDINKCTKIVINKMINANNLEMDDIISVIFSVTKDLTKAYPAVAARELGITESALFCTQEMFVEGSAKMCIRVLMNVEKDISKKDINHAYMNGAEKLRPDLKA